jgi:hypothetical protein
MDFSTIKIADTVLHCRFGLGIVISIDKTTYSIPMAIVNYSGVEICRPLSELEKVDNEHYKV